MRKYFFLVLIIVFAASASLFYFSVKIFFKVRQTEDKTMFSERFLGETQEAKTVIEKTILGKDVQINSLKAELDAEKTKSIELSRKLSEKVNEILTVKDDLRKSKEEVTNLNEKVQKEREKQKDLIRENDKISKEAKELSDRIEKMKVTMVAKESVEQGTAGSSAQAALVVKPSAPQKTEGKVLVINEKFNFIVIDLGKVDDIRKDQTLYLIRDSVIVGKVRVEKVYEKMCSAVMLKDTFKIDLPVKGDLVKV